MTGLRRLRSLVKRRLGTAATQAELRAARRRAERYAAAYRELVAAIEGGSAALDDAGRPPSARVIDRVRNDVLLTQMRGEFFELLSRGETLAGAAVEAVRKLIKARHTAEAVSFADSLASVPETATAGHLAAAVAATHRKLPDLAYAEFKCVPADLWRAYAIGEFLEATFQSDPEQASALLHDLVEGGYDDVVPEGWLEVVRFAFAVREKDLAQRAYELLTERSRIHRPMWADAEAEIEWLWPWVERDVAAASPIVPEGHVPFALIDYRQPGRAKTSKNIGDHIQTLASLGHLVRHQNVSFHGDDDLVGFVRMMQQRVRPERRLDSAWSDVALFTVDRDASSYANVPVGTWMFAFGWFLHPLFGLRHDFPLQSNLRPIFVSFHCNKREMLTPAAIEYLRRYGPVGCRDWTTVDLLLSIGVPAFFSGCLTTTVDTVFPDLQREERPVEADTVYVDVPGDLLPVGAPTVRHSHSSVRMRTLAANMREAVEMLERYRRQFTKVVTSRLHCYLPVRALGVEVDFRPKNRADVRLNGLIDIDDTAFETIRTRMLAQLETITTAILAGKPETEIYQLWRDINADDVAAARARQASAGFPSAPSFDVVEVAAQVRAVTVTSGPAEPALAVDIVSLVGPGDIDRLPVTLNSLLANASRPIRLWLLARDCGPNDHEGLMAAFPDVPLNWMPCDGLPIDSRPILLPEVMPELDRITVLPPAAVVLGDITKLADWDLGETPLAARTSLGIGASSGFRVFYRAAKRLKANASAAHELYRHVHSRHVFDFDAFDTEVLVLDLSKMRKDGTAAEFLPYIEQFGLTAAEALILYTGPNRTVLPPEWAHVPTDERVAEPLLVHWPRSPKPWQDLYVAKRELWRERAAVRA